MISVIIPSVRPKELKNCINALVSGTVDVDFEIITVTDFECFLAGGIKHKWVYQKERKGVVSALNLGFINSSGDYVFTLSDEAFLYPNALRNLQRFCQKRDNKVLCSPYHLPDFNFSYYGKYFAPFPFIHRSLLDKIGPFFDPIYKCFYADPDLSLRVYEAGHDVMICPDAVISHPNNMNCPIHIHNVSKYVDSDRETFKKRWKQWGEFKEI